MSPEPDRSGREILVSFRGKFLYETPDPFRHVLDSEGSYGSVATRVLESVKGCYPVIQKKDLQQFKQNILKYSEIIKNSKWYI